MKKLCIALLVTFAGLGFARDNVFSIQLEGGWFNGLSGEGGIAMFNIGGAPFGARLGVGYTTTVALDPAVAQNAGISLSRNSAQNITFGLDLSYSIDFQSDFTLTPYLGGRFNLFSGVFQQGVVTGPVDTSQFGFGGGLRFGYFIDRQFSFLADVGVDYFFESDFRFGNNTFKGSDNFTGTTTKVGDIVNDPRLVVKARIGLVFNFQ